MAQPPSTTAKGLYSRLEPDRQPYLRRARDAAELTIPSLMPEEGHGATTKLKTPYQSLGARGVNNLASKLLMALMPPNAPFFRLRVDDKEIEEAAEQTDAVADLEKALGKIEREVMAEIERIMQEDGPIVQPLWRAVFAAANNRVKGFRLHPVMWIFGEELAVES